MVLDFNAALLKKEIAQLEADLDNPDSTIWAEYDKHCMESLEHEFFQKGPNHE